MPKCLPDTHRSISRKSCTPCVPGKRLWHARYGFDIVSIARSSILATGAQTMSRTATSIAVSLIFSVLAPAALCQPYPAKLVRIVNPVAPGGNQDVVARAYAEQFARVFGQPFVVENRPGYGAVVGTRFVKSAPADGYTLLSISNTFARTPTLVKDAGYDPLKDFAAISMTSDTALVFTINPALPARTVKEFIALAKKRPGEISSAGGTIGSTGHVAAEMFSRQAGIKLLHIQYKGTAPAVADLVGGHIMLAFGQVTTSLPHIRSGKLRALGVTSAKRSVLMPEVPTIDEAGLPGFLDTTFNGLMAPAGTPRAIVERLRAEVATAAGIAELRKRYQEMGIELLSSNTPEEFASFLKTHVEEFIKLARDAGMTTN
jgi:tripartite-type tricarboxylate transporter receptor subunit TctC